MLTFSSRQAHNAARSTILRGLLSLPLLLALLFLTCIPAFAQVTVTTSPAAPPAVNNGGGLVGKYYGKPFQLNNTVALNYINANAPLMTFTALRVAYQSEGASVGNGTSLMSFLTGGGNANASSFSTNLYNNNDLNGQLFAFDGFLNVTPNVDRNAATPGIQVDLGVGSDDGSFVDIGNQRILDAGGVHSFFAVTNTFTFSQPGLYPIRIVYYENGGVTGVTFYARTGTQTNYTATPTSMLHGTTLAQVTKTVDGKSGPWLWNNILNSTFKFGNNSHIAPTIFSASDGFDFTAGNTLTVNYISGLTSAFGGTPYSDANGDTSYLANGNGGSSGLGFPSRYISAAQYPAYLNTLIGTFADNFGQIVGTPFKVGNGPTSLIIPSGATRLQLGLNDDIFGDNTGSFQIQVSGLFSAVGVDTFITDGPAPGSTVGTNSVEFGFSGYSPNTPANQLTFQYRLDNGTYVNATPNSVGVVLTGLANGLHTFEVRAVDQFGISDTTPAARVFTVDTTPTLVSMPIITNLAYNGATVNWQTNKPTKGVVEVSLNDGNPFQTVLSYNDNSISTNHSLGVGPLKSNTQYRVRVVAQDGGGTPVATSAVTNFTTPPFRDLSVETGDISFSNPAPADGQSVTMSVRVRNRGDLNATATIVFSDVDPTGVVREISRTSVSAPAFAANDPVVTSAPFAVGQGTHRPNVAILNPQPGDEIANNNFASRDLQVGAPAQRLKIEAATQQTFPGDDRLFTIIAKNTGSQPIALTNGAVSGVGYVFLASALPAAPIAPGDEATLTYRVQTVGETGGTPNNPIVRPLSVNISGFTRTFDLLVYSAPVGNLDVTVLNNQNGQPINGALVAIDSSDRLYITGPDGKLRDINNGAPTTISVTPGNLTLFGYARGFVGDSINLGATAGTNAVTLRLEPGETLEVRQVTATPLTLQQIQERGVNLQDPANFTVVDFVLYMKIGPVIIPNVVVPIGGGGGGAIVGGGTFPVGGGGSVVNVQWKIDPTTNTETWIVIPGDVRILKQFWDATVFIHNNSNSLTVQGVSATLSVPSGLALPDLNGASQSTSQTIENIPPRGVRQASWVVRGDRTGKYRLSGTATGSIVLGGTTIPLSSTLQSDEIEVVIPIVGITFNTPTRVVAGEEFTVGVNVQNQSKINLQKVDVHIKDNQLVNCVLAPNEVNLKTIGALAPNETKTANFRFVSLVTGSVLEVRSYIAPQPVEPGITVTPAPNRPPVAVDDSAGTTQGQSANVTVLTNDSDADGHTLTVQSATSGSNGTTTINPLTNQILYTPNPAFIGLDSFTYTISDGNGGTATATVRVQVNEANATPARLELSAVTNVIRVGNVITATATIRNAGGTAANNIVLTQSQLGTAATTTSPLPTILGLEPGASANVTLTYPATAGAPAQAVFLRINGTRTGNAFQLSRRVVLP